MLVSADLRGHPVDAVLGLATTALVLLDVLPRRAGHPGPTSGLALGVAIALHPALLLFAAALPRPGPRPSTRIRPALTAFTVAVLLHGVVRLADPARAARFRHRFDDPAATGDPANQTALGVLLRLGLHGPPLLAVWLAVAVTAVVLALRRARTLARDGQPLLAAGVLGCATLVIAPSPYPPTSAGCSSRPPAGSAAGPRTAHCGR